MKTDLMMRAEDVQARYVEVQRSLALLKADLEQFPVLVRDRLSMGRLTTTVSAIRTAEIALSHGYVTLKLVAEGKLAQHGEDT